MKKTSFLKGILVLFAVAPMLAGCTNDGKTETQFLKLSDVVCTFQKEGDSQTITVKSNLQWSIEGGASWLHVTEQTDKSFTLVADKNEDIERIATIAVKGGGLSRSIVVKQLGEDGEFAKYRLMANWKNAVVSPNGKYAGGVTVDIAADDSFEYCVEIVSLETEETVVHGPYPESLYLMGNAYGISDDGTIYVENLHGGSVEVKLNGENNKTAVPDGATGVSKIMNVSADGSVLVGYASGSSDGNAYAPVKIDNGVATILPIPESNFRDEEWWAGVLARGVSADGSIIYGTSWENLMINDLGLVYWDSEGVHWAGEDVHELVQTVTFEDGLGNPYTYNLYNGMTSNGAGNYQISPNGKWIAGTYRTEALSEDGTGIEYGLYPAFYNTETKKTTIFRELSDHIGMAVSDEGIGFAAASAVNQGVPMGAFNGVALDIENGTQISSQSQWIQDHYGIVVPSEIYIQYVGVDGKMVLGGIRLANAAFDNGVAVNWYILATNEE